MLSFSDTTGKGRPPEGALTEKPGLLLLTVADLEELMPKASLSSEARTTVALGPRIMVVAPVMASSRVSMCFGSLALVALGACVLDAYMVVCDERERVSDPFSMVRSASKLARRKEP